MTDHEETLPGNGLSHHKISECEVNRPETDESGAWVCSGWMLDMVRRVAEVVSSYQGAGSRHQQLPALNWSTAEHSLVAASARSTGNYSALSDM